MLPADHPDLAAVQWRKARASDNGQGCVELARLRTGEVAIRDSRDPAGPAQVYPSVRVRALIAAARCGQVGR
jgi:hypothetical protein